MFSFQLSKIANKLLRNFILQTKIWTQSYIKRYSKSKKGTFFNEIFFTRMMLKYFLIRHPAWTQRQSSIISATMKPSQSNQTTINLNPNT
jgi:hypothetical protein